MGVQTRGVVAPSGRCTRCRLASKDGESWRGPGGSIWGEKVGAHGVLSCRKNVEGRSTHCPWQCVSSSGSYSSRAKTKRRTRSSMLLGT